MSNHIPTASMATPEPGGLDERRCECPGDIVNGEWVYGGVPEDTCPIHNMSNVGAETIHLEPVCTVVGNTIYIKYGNGVAVGTYNPEDGKKQAWMAFMGNAELAFEMAELINRYMPARAKAESR